MNKEIISEPFLDKNNKKLLDFLGKRGINIKWYKASNLKGRAYVNVEDKNAEIVFRNESSITQYVLSHELFHIVLFINGYPKIKCKEEYLEYNDSVTMLSDIFAHIIMTPILDKLGYSIQKEERPKIEGTIDKLNEWADKLPDDFAKKMLLNILYVRAQRMGVRGNKLKQLEDYLRGNNLYDDNIIAIIVNRLPKPDCRAEEYKELLKKCIEELKLHNIVEFEYFE